VKDEKTAVKLDKMTVDSLVVNSDKSLDQWLAESVDADLADSLDFLMDCTLEVKKDYYLADV
jgi:hypothetical protein